MKNKQLAQLALSLLIILFCLGFYSGWTKTPIGGILTLGSFASCAMQIWVICRLWKAKDETCCKEDK